MLVKRQLRRRTKESNRSTLATSKGKRWRNLVKALHTVTDSTSLAHADSQGNPRECTYFLSGYLSKTHDPINFPPDQSDLFQRYEDIFRSALQTFGLSKEALKGRSEFNFDSGNAANLESAVAVLRVVEALRREGFVDIMLVKPPGADLTCTKNGHKTCCEVKAITKQSSGRDNLYFADQVYEKVLESISKAKTQLETIAAELQCTVTIYACVMNWLEQSILLTRDDYQGIVNKLEKDQDQESLKGIDGVLFVTKLGQQFLFLDETRDVHKLLGIPRI